MKRQLAVLSCVLVICAATPAAAQYINSGASSGGGARVPQGTFSEQGLTTNQQDLSVYVGPLANPKFGTIEEAGLQAVRIPATGEFAWILQAGAAYGIVKGLEAGLFTPSLVVSPEVDSGGLPLFITWGSSVDDVDFGLRNTLTIPLSSGEDWGWNPGLHMLVRFAGGRFDLGAFFPMAFGNNQQVVAGLEVPMRMTFKIVRELFVGLDTGIRKFDIANGSNDVFAPLGGYLVYSLEAGAHSIDLSGRFDWQTFLWLNAPEGVTDRILQEAYTISLGANFHFDIGD